MNTRINWSRDDHRQLSRRSSEMVDLFSHLVFVIEFHTMITPEMIDAGWIGIQG